MSRLGLALLAVLLIGGGTLGVLFLISEEAALEEGDFQPESQVVTSVEADDPALQGGLKKPAGRWTGPPDEHPAARLRKNRMEKGRFGIPPRKRGGQALLRRPLWDQEFGRAALTRAGYSPEEIARLESQYEDARDRALRELGLGPYGGGESSGFAEEKRAQEALADLIVDVDAYDATLFATGQPNRLKVKNVMPLGRSLGLQPGDFFWEYNGERIFPYDGYMPRMQADQAQGLHLPVTIYRPGSGFFQVLLPPEKHGFGVVTQPISSPPGLESEPAAE